MKGIAFAALLMLLAPVTQAQVQDHCIETDTRASCLSKMQALANAQEQGQEAAGKQILAAKNTGEGAIGASGTQSATNDFLPLLRAILDTQGLEQDDGKIGLEWSNPLGLPAAHQNKLTAVLARSNVHQPLSDALRAASLGDEVGALQDRIHEGDDITFGFSYSPASQRRGRDPDLHEDLYSAVLHAANQPDESVALTRAQRVAIERDLGLPRQSAESAETFAQLFARPEVAGRPDVELKKAEYIQAVESEFRAQFGALAGLQQRLEQRGFYGMLDLINNQPQLSVTANYRVRDDAVGPDEFNATVSYEVGWYNVNTFRNAARNCDDEAKCLSGYLSRPEVVAGVKQSPRLSFSAEYSKRKRLQFALGGSAFTFVEQPQERLKVSANYARYLGGETAMHTRARVDASLGYEDFSDDPLRQNRGVATATLTYPIAAGFYLSLGAVYATKPEFRGEVDSELTARAGFTYKLLREE
jgi:hypothetical protein